jgi:predicted hotdog family 3-hydroxylacyl-ACP dehydratase
MWHIGKEEPNKTCRFLPDSWMAQTVCFENMATPTGIWTGLIEAEEKLVSISSF